MEAYRSLDDLASGIVNEAAMSRRGFLGKAVGFGIAMAGLERMAYGATGSGDPIADLPSSSTAVNGFWLPREWINDAWHYTYGYATGGDANLGNELVVCTEDGFLLFYEINDLNAPPTAPSKVVDTGYNNVKGIAIAPDGYVIADGTDIRRGTVVQDGSGWRWQEHAENGTIASDGSWSATHDIDILQYSPRKTSGLDYLIIIATPEGIRRVDAVDGSTTQIISNGPHESIGIMEFKNHAYDNPVLQSNENFNNINLDAMPTSGGKIVDYTATPEQGTTWGQNFFAPIYADSVGLHPAWDIQQYMKPVGSFSKADFDKDGDVDMDDYTEFENCATGPAIPQTDPAKQKADFDSDGDVDQSDFGIFQREFTG